MDKNRIEKALARVIHPVKDKDLITLEMIEDIKIEEGRVRFKLVFPSPDPLASSIKKSCEEEIKREYPDLDFKISIMELVRERKIQKRLNLELGQEAIANVGHIIAIASGKGGVGKSTVAVNLAVDLAKECYRVGLTVVDLNAYESCHFVFPERRGIGSAPEIPHQIKLMGYPH